MKKFVCSGCEQIKAERPALSLKGEGKLLQVCRECFLEEMRRDKG